MHSPLSHIRRKLASFRWRFKARKKHAVGLRVTDVPRVLQRFEEHAIRAVVLRWFDEVPRSAASENSGQDVDLLIDGRGIEAAVQIAADSPGPVKCDLYSNSGVRGTTYRGLPYYTPVLAERILANRRWNDCGFYVPAPQTHLLSLAYHLCYHKGLESGIETGCSLLADQSPKRNYAGLISRLAREVGEAFSLPVSLLGLHEHLRRHGWEIPLDLLARWPKPTAWHRWLREYETQPLTLWSQRLPHLLVFFVRGDTVERGLTESACGLLAEKFTVLAVRDLDHAAVERVTRKVRGGNWIEHNKTTLVPPRVAVVCYDQHPTPVSPKSSVGSRRRKVATAYPHVGNANVLFKHEIRERLNRLAPAGSKLHAIHGADNALESQYMLRTAFGAASEQMNEAFLKEIMCASLQPGGGMKAA